MSTSTVQKLIIISPCLFPRNNKIISLKEGWWKSIWLLHTLLEARIKNSVSNQHFFLISPLPFNNDRQRCIFQPLGIFFFKFIFCFFGAVFSDSAYFWVVQTDNIFCYFLKSHTIYTGTFCLSWFLFQNHSNRESWVLSFVWMYMKLNWGIVQNSSQSQWKAIYKMIFSFQMKPETKRI